MHNYIWAIASVLTVSLISLVGLSLLSIKEKKLNSILIYLVSFSAGSMLGDAFIHILPNASNKNGFTLFISFAVLTGITISFVVEKLIQWRHCHHTPLHQQKHRDEHTFAYMNLAGDAAHNLIDGLIIGASYIISIPVGI